MRSATSVITCGLLILSVGRPLGAQHAPVVEAGIAAAHFPSDNVSAGGTYIRLSAAGVTRNMFGSVDAGAMAAFGASSGYGSLQGGWRSRTGPGLGAMVDAELASVAGSSHNGAAGTGIVTARGMWSSDNTGGWLRAMAHRSERTNSTLNGAGVDLTGWYSFPRAQASASLIGEWTRAELYTGQFRTGFVGTMPVRYAEGNATLHAESDRMAVDASAALRRDPDADELWEPAINLTLTMWAGDRVAFVIGGGKQLADWVRGADEAQTFTVGLRYRQASPTLERAEHILPIVQVTEEDGRIIRVRAAGASTVDVMGDFTEWESRALTRNGDVFRSPIALSAGPHRLLVRVNGGPWRAAVNTPIVDDDLGGKVGLLVVP